jgi:hypothetical protein
MVSAGANAERCRRGGTCDAQATAAPAASADTTLQFDKVGVNQKKGLAKTLYAHSTHQTLGVWRGSPPAMFWCPRNLNIKGSL